MFAKLLKYERKATAPLLSLLSLICLTTAALCGGAIVLSKITWENPIVETLIGLSVGLAFVIFVISVIAYCLAATLLVLYRFYKSKFTDEGYLTFTLPVKPGQLFLSSLLNLMFWQIISVCVIGLSLLLLFWIGGYLPDIGATFRKLYGTFQEIFRYPGAPSFWILLPAGIITWVFGNIMAMTCIVLGAAWAKKHKLLLAFALYYGINCVLQFFLSLLSAGLILTQLENINAAVFTNWLYGGPGIFYLLLTVGAYLLSIRMMSKKLNLP